MAIDVICPDCDTKHKVKDDAAGKKLKCKGCQKLIPIPAPAPEAEADPWENLDENEAGEELPPVVRQPAKKSGKSKRSGSRGGMPIAIKVSIGINGVQIAIMTIAIVIKVISGNFNVAGGFFRPVIDFVLIQGLMGRQKRARWQSIILDAVGLGTLFLCLVPIVLFSLQQEGSPAQKTLSGGTGALLIAGTAVQAIFWIVDLVLLMTRPAKEWCNE